MKKGRKLPGPGARLVAERHCDLPVMTTGRSQCLGGQDYCSPFMESSSPGSCATDGG